MDIIYSLNGGDFEVWKEEMYGIDFYFLGIEGHLGFNSIQDCINLYTYFLDEFELFLIEEGYDRVEMTDELNRGLIYSTRSLDVYKDPGIPTYLIHTDRYKSTDIWSLYYYLRDIIEQLKDVLILEGGGQS